MVGVPRSKGCRTCVTRRVRCDLAKPVCKNCEKGNRDCFFTDDFKFQDEGAKLRKRFAKNTPPESQSPAPTPFFVEPLASSSSSESPESIPPDVSWAERMQLSSQASEISRTSTPFDFATYPSGYETMDPFAGRVFVVNDDQSVEDADQINNVFALTKRSIHMEDPFEAMSVTAALTSPGLIQEQLLGVLQAALAPTSQRVAVPIPLRNHGGWLVHLPTLTGQNQLLDSAIRAVSLAHMGQLFGNEVFKEESRPYYGKAIRLLSSTLTNYERGMSSETLSATILLSFYEMFSSSSVDSWVKHAGGAGALMKMRGPDRHRYGFDREIFLACRHTIIIEAFHTDEKCFLSQPEWIQLSRDIHEDKIKGVQNADSLEMFKLAEDFYESMCHIPELLHDARNFRTTYIQNKAKFATMRSFKEDLIRRITTTRTDLKAYFVKFEGCVMKLDLRWTSYPSFDPVIPHYYNFSNIFISSSCTGYWTVLVIVNFVLMELQRTTSPEKEELYKMENRECALEICRSTPYMLTSSFLGPLFCIFGLRVCLVSMENGAERDWVLNKLFEIGETHMAMAAHIPGHHPGTGMPKVRASVGQAGVIEYNEDFAERRWKPPTGGQYLQISEVVESML